MSKQHDKQAALREAVNPRLTYRRLGLRWRGKLAIPPHAHPIVRRMYQEANAQQTTLTEIADRAGLRRCSVPQWGKKNHPRLDQIEAALNVLGYRLAVVGLERD